MFNCFHLCCEQEYFEKVVKYHNSKGIRFARDEFPLQLHSVKASCMTDLEELSDRTDREELPDLEEVSDLEDEDNDRE